MSNSQDLAAQASMAMNEGRAAEAAELLGILYSDKVFCRAARTAYAVRNYPRALDAEDLEHELYVHVQQRIASFDPSLGSFNSWLARVASRLLLDMLKKSKRFPKTLDTPEDRPGQDEGSELQSQLSQQESKTVLSTPFNEQDWECIVAWGDRNPRDPLLVIVGHGFWSKLSNDPNPQRHQQWQAWCEACDIDEYAELEMRLNETAASGDLDKQLGELRDFLAISDVTFRKDWSRKQHLIAELQAFWDFYLTDVEQLTGDQVAILLQANLCLRVPVMCIDQHWHRSQNAAQWRSFRVDFKFCGIPPLLRFIPRSSLRDRVDIFARALPGDIDENKDAIYGMLAESTTFRRLISPQIA